MDMTPIDTRTSRSLDGPLLTIVDRPPSSSELAIGVLYALILVPALVMRVLFHVLGGQIRLVGSAVAACAEEVARARRN